MRLKRRRAFGCAPLVAIAVGLSLFGLLMQYSASSYAAFTRTGDEFFFVKKQAVAMVAAFCCMLFFSRVDARILAKISPVLLVVSIAALAALFIPGLGVEMYGATRWLNLGFATVQPSELAKFALVLFIAATLTKDREIGKGAFVLCAFAAISVCVLIMLEPHMSIAVLVALVAVFMMFVCGVKLKWFAALSVPAVAAAVLLVVAEPYRLKRLLAFLDPWASPLGEGYQLIQSYYALGSGGIFGVGLFNSRQKYLFLPFAESDFVFAVVGEELGYAKSSVSRGVNLLKQKGYIDVDAVTGNISFTESGRRKAEGIYSRHRTLTQALIKLGADRTLAEENACRIEHVVSDEMMAVFERFLNG